MSPEEIKSFVEQTQQAMMFHGVLLQLLMAHLKMSPEEVSKIEAKAHEQTARLWEVWNNVPIEQSKIILSS